MSGSFGTLVWQNAFELSPLNNTATKAAEVRIARCPSETNYSPSVNSNQRKASAILLFGSIIYDFATPLQFKTPIYLRTEDSVIAVKRAPLIFLNRIPVYAATRSRSELRILSSRTRIPVEVIPASCAISSAE